MKCITEVYSRIVGYFSPMSQWNKGKQSERKDLKHLNINSMIKKEDADEGRSSKTGKDN